MQAAVQVGFERPHPVGFVRTAGQLALDHGPSATCSGTQTSFSGITDQLQGIDVHTGVKTNADWQVLWDYTQTAFSACGVAGFAGFVPDSGATFANVCHL